MRFRLLHNNPLPFLHTLIIHFFLTFVFFQATQRVTPARRPPMGGGIKINSPPSTQAFPFSARRKCRTHSPAAAIDPAIGIVSDLQCQRYSAKVVTGDQTLTPYGIQPVNLPTSAQSVQATDHDSYSFQHRPNLVTTCQPFSNSCSAQTALLTRLISHISRYQ